MAAKVKNPVWAFLASVQLALVLIGLLASTSIIGTVIQQNQPPEHYTEAWGKSGAAMIQALDLDDMYSSVWFLFLLGAFSLNLTVCSLDRLPGVIRLAHKDNLETEPEQLLKMKMQRNVQAAGPAALAADKAAAWLANNGWKTASRPKEAGILLFAQKGAWTRYGVYVVHISILIILLGAVIGSPTVAKKLLQNPQFAFKGSVLLPELRETSRIFSFDDESEIPLGFAVRCDFFDIHFYDNGMPKDYISGLTISENGKEMLSTTIEVNKPLIYKGVTFYQSSYNDMKKPIIHLTNMKTGKKFVFSVDPQQWDKTHSWQDESGGQGMVRIKDAQSVPSPSGEGMTTEMQIWLMDSQGPPSMFALSYGRPVIVERPSAKYELRIGPHYATGLQVSKDPGVWWVYSGCALMLLGLYVAFFMSHRKVWAWVQEKDGGAAVVFIGQANKNSLGFEKTFAALAEGFGSSTQSTHSAENN
ncbi:cytochrome c biogenesis protein ResB [Candidatus Electronema sp. TJ]|uniref:cytochrome c biogenesis protein ResB n=1 Tax=Candidatus Electronema sp. TJ TaxID=3401573 RepID=UPI003AA81709